MPSCCFDSDPRHQFVQVPVAFSGKESERCAPRAPEQNARSESQVVAVKIEPVVEIADQLEITARSAQLLRILVLTVNEQAFEILQSLGGKWENAVGVKHKGQLFAAYERTSSFQR